MTDVRQVDAWEFRDGNIRGLVWQIGEEWQAVIPSTLYIAYAKDRAEAIRRLLKLVQDD